jgi:hypothetical protein
MANDSQIMQKVQSAVLATRIFWISARGAGYLLLLLPKRTSLANQRKILNRKRWRSFTET